MYDKYGQFIDGKWQKSASGETYDVINPATEEVIGKASKANSSDVQKALKSAKKGLQIWKNTSPWERSKIIRKISDLIRKRVNVLSKWLTLEVGKPLTEGPGEIGGAADIFEWNSEETKRIFGEINQSRFPNTQIHVMYQPVGVVAALVPWNFPIILASRKISTALAAGCSVIVKPDVISIDYDVDPKKIVNEIKIPIQGGLDPKVLLTDQKTLKIEVEKYLSIFKDHPYIFNLGHGILPETKIEMVEELIKIVRNFK